jgi:hypothetical protein
LVYDAHIALLPQIDKIEHLSKIRG